MRLHSPAILLGLSLAALGGVAEASSPDAWAAFDTRVAKACAAASGIPVARTSRIVGFDDRVGMVALLVSGPVRGRAQPALCLYDKRTGKAYVDEAAGWSAPPHRR